MATTTFNPNEVVFEKIRYVEEFDPSTMELMARYSQIKDPSLQTSADGTQVTDADGAEIVTFYNAQTGTFGFTNALMSLDLAANQFGGGKKLVATTDNKMKIPVSETITIGTDNTATLTYVPVGESGAEVKYAQVVNEENEFGQQYEVSATAGEGKFTIDAKEKKLTFPEGVKGKALVSYYRETDEAVAVEKNTDTMPPVRTLWIHCWFRNKCDTNIKYVGVIVCPRAQIDPSSIDLNLTPDGGHPASYKLQKPYCDDTSRLFTIYVSK